jgi:hypothetical protein
MTGRGTFMHTFAERHADLQQPFDAAVVMPTVIRPEIRDALRSIFRQDLSGRVQVLIGIDSPAGDPSLLEAICLERPPNCVVQVFYPGYSTSVRHGGISPARECGALRCILSYLANSPFVAYLDDDNWWRADHLRLMRQAVEMADYAFALRWFVHPQSRTPVCVDVWESVGPGRGDFVQKFGGFVDPNCLMLNKVTCEPALAMWNCPNPLDPRGLGSDRMVFDVLREFFRGAGTDQPSVFYTVNPNDGRHPSRVARMGQLYDEAGI